MTTMDKLRLDYQRSMKPFPAAGVILLLAVTALLALAGDYYYQLNVKAEAWEDSLSGEASAASAAADAAIRGGQAGDIRLANEVLRQLTLPWEDLFSAVESSTNARVTLLSLEPDVEKRVVNISCEARNVAAMLTFIERLQQRQAFESIYLQSHQIQEFEPERPVRFSLVASWKATT